MGGWRVKGLKKGVTIKAARRVAFHKSCSMAYFGVIFANTPEVTPADRGAVPTRRQTAPQFILKLTTSQGFYQWPGPSKKLTRTRDEKLFNGPIITSHVVNNKRKLALSWAPLLVFLVCSIVRSTNNWEKSSNQMV